MNEPRTDLLTCVVLTPLDRSIDPGLYATLAARSWTPRVEHDPRMAMAEACLVRRELQLRAAWQDLETSLVPGLILLAEDHSDEVESLRIAMDRHVPEIPIWTARDGELVPINDAAAETEDPESTSIAADEDLPPLVFHPADGRRDAEPLSRDEVSMLLNDSPEGPDQKDPGPP